MVSSNHDILKLDLLFFVDMRFYRLARSTVSTNEKASINSISFCIKRMPLFYSCPSE